MQLQNVEIIDTSGKPGGFLELVQARIKAGLARLENAPVKIYRFEP